MTVRPGSAESYPGIDEIDLLVPAPAALEFLDSLRLRLGVPGDRVSFTALGEAPGA